MDQEGGDLKENENLSLVQLVSDKFIHRSGKVLRLAVPAMIAITITFGYMLINIAYAGRLVDSEYALAGIGLSNVLINGLWFTTFNGVSGAL